MAMPRWFGYQFRQWINDRYLEDNNRDLNEVRVVVFDDDRNDIAAIPASKIGSGGGISSGGVTDTEEVRQDTRLSAVEAKDTQQDTRISAVEAKDTQQDTAIAAKANQSDVDALETSVGDDTQAASSTGSLRQRIKFIFAWFGTPTGTYGNTSIWDWVQRFDTRTTTNTTALAAKADQSAVDLKADQSEVDQIVDGADLSASTVSMNAFDTRLDALEAGGGGTTPELTNLTTTVQGIRSDLGNPNDAASATGSAFARIKQNVSTIAARVTTATLNALNIGSPSDSPNVTGSLWARVLRNRNSVNNAHDLIGESSDPASATGSLFARIKQNASDISDRVLTSVFTTLQNRVGTPPSVNFRYYSNETTSSISSGSASGQTIWNWLARYSVSIVNLRNRLGAKLDTTTFTNARVGEPDDTADSATTASLWAQFKQALVTLGNKLNTSTWTNARVGTPADAASSADSATSWAQLKQVKIDVTSATGGGTIDSGARTRLDTLEGNVGTPSDYTGNGNINGSVFARLRWLYQAVNGRVTTATFNTLSGLVGGRPSTTYYYFISATASALSSANANTQAVWGWLSRFSNSIKNLADRFTAARIGLPANAADDDTAASLWAQFKNALAVINNILGGQTGHTAVNVEHINLRVIDQRLGNTSTPSAEDSTKAWGRIRWLGTTIGNKLDTATFNALSNLVGTRASITYYYFASFTTTALSSANANTQSVWTWITRLSNSIKNLGDRFTAARIGTPDDPASAATTASLWAQFKQSLTNTGGGGGGGVSQAAFQALANAVGAVSDTANIAGTTLWNRMNQVTEWIGNRQGELWYYYSTISSSNITFANSDIGSIWGWLGRFGRSFKNLHDKYLANTAAIAAIDTSSAATTSRVVADITQEDATQDQWSIGNIVGDLLTGVLNYVKGTPTPIDYTIQLSSTARTGGSLGANESLIDGHWVFGFTRANVALPNIANTIPNSSLGEVAPNVTGDLGDDIDAVLNVTNHSLSSGYMLVAMKVDADYVPKNLRVRTSGGTETVNHALQLSQTTATHKIYVTDHSDELQWGDVFGISSEGNFTADIGFRDANNENYLQGNIVKSFAPFPLSKYTRTFFGAMENILRVEKPGDMYIADDGDILISKEILTGDLGYLIYPISTGNRYFGFSAETIGAISTFLAPATSGATFDIQKTITKLLYDSVNDEIVVDFNKKNSVVEGARSLSVRTGHTRNFSNTPASSHFVINAPLVIKPEADSIGTHARYAGCKSPGNNSTIGYKHPTITPAYSGTAATYFGASMNPIVGYKRTASGTSYGTSSDNGNWKTGDTIVVDRSIADRAVRVTSRAESHTEIKNIIMGQKINFEEEGSLTGGSGGSDNRELHFRIPAANASGALNTNEGSLAQTNHDIGLYEVKLEFHNSGNGSYIHVCLPANYISGTQKLALFLKPITPGAAADFDKMDLANDKYYVLSYHSKIHDWSDSIAGTYARYKWDLPDDAHTQLAAHFDADINGSMFVGLAVIEETGSGNDRAISDFTSWLPVPYSQIYVDGVHIDLTLDSVRAIRAGSTRSRLEYHYKTNSYTQSQRDRYYADSVPETEKDILVSGREVAINLKNREGMYHIPFDITHIKPFIKDEPFYANFDYGREHIGRQTITLTATNNSWKSIAWDRVVRAETHSHNETEDSTDITEARFEVFDREIEPDYTRQEKHAIDSVDDLYPSKYLAIPFDVGSVYERASGSNANDMDDSDLISEKQSFAVDSDQIEGSVIIEDIYLNADNTGTNQITFRVGHDIANSSTTLPDTIIHHPLSGAKLTIPGVAASTTRATKAYQDGKRVFSVSSGANWDKSVSLAQGDKISVQLMGGQAHNSPQLMWYKLIN